MKQVPLLPLTKLILGVTALVQLLMAIAAFLVPDLTRNLLSPSQQSPTIAIQYVGAFYLAGAVAAAYAFRQDNWIAARTYLLNAGLFVALAIIVTLTNAPVGIQPISWLYILLSAIYVPLVGWVWLQESKRNASA
jgi:hypothetical protein